MIPPVNGVAGGKSSTSKVQATVLKNHRASTITEQLVRCLGSIENRQQFAYASDQATLALYSAWSRRSDHVVFPHFLSRSLSALGQAPYFDVSGKKHSAVRERAIKKGLRRRTQRYDWTKSPAIASLSITRTNLLWDVVDPKETRREASFAEGAINFGIGRDQ
jgi:hypothetical protein